MKKAIVLLLAIMTAGAALYAQESYLELLRSDIRTQKVALITDAMELTDTQSAVFWPIYRKYDSELTTLNDKRIAIIKDYAQNYDQMTAAKADELTKQTFAFFENRIKLQKKYTKEISKALSPVLSGKFMQIERAINTLLDLQIQSEIPLVKK
jgi:hypothetical protein